MPLIAVPESLIWLGSPIDDATTFANMVSAACDSVITYLGFDPQSQVWTERYNGNDAQVLALNSTPVTSLTSLSIMNQLMPAVVDRVVDPAQIIVDQYALYWPAGKFTRGIKNIQVVYTAGYLTTDQNLQTIRAAAFMTMKAMWTGRGADQNASGESFAGVLSQSFWATGPGAVPPQARDLLDPYVRRFVSY